MHRVSRRSFLAAGSVGMVGAASGGHAGVAALRTRDHPEPFRIRAMPARVADFVGACHVRIDRVREMLAEEPGLARAAWDWGFGDWETAIGACSHTGRIEIIELLLAHGARPDVFTMATLDEVDAVRAFVERVPNAGDIEGPHSISLFRHARAGGAERVADYLASVGLDDTRDRFAMDEAVARPLTGTFAWGSGADRRIEIGWSERLSCLTLAMEGEATRNLMPIDGGPAASKSEHLFRPAGSASARVSFPTSDRLVVQYLGRTLEAGRTG